MNYPYDAEIGNALGMYGPNYGYGPYGVQTVWGEGGADGDPVSQALANGADPSHPAIQEALARRGGHHGMGRRPHPGQFGFGGGFCAPPGYLSQDFDNRRLKSIALAQNCGAIEMETFLPFEGPYIVAAGGTVTLTATAQIICKAQKLMIAASEGVSLLVTSFRCGIMPLLAGEGQMSAYLFSEVAKSPLLNGVTAQVGQKFFLTVRNITNQEQDINPAIAVVAVLNGGTSILGGAHGT